MKNGEQQAFPVINPEYDGNWDKEPYKPGLTKREYFAGLAMQGILAKQFDNKGEDIKETILDAIEYADELSKQLEQ